eukprot:1188274-Prorocentrum_minimum.AAC.1
MILRMERRQTIGMQQRFRLGFMELQGGKPTWTNRRGASGYIPAWGPIAGEPAGIFLRGATRTRTAEVTAQPRLLFKYSFAIVNIAGGDVTTVRRTALFTEWFTFQVNENDVPPQQADLSWGTREELKSAEKRDARNKFQGLQPPVPVTAMGAHNTPEL